MKVAIVGAGLSGLSCAIELERHGIKPVIFEKRAHVGEAIHFSTIWPRMINRPIMDPLKYLKEEYKLDLTPLNHIKRIVIHSQKSRAVERGSLGYIFYRGCHRIALENQLLNYINTPISFNQYIEIDDIKNEFDYIIVAYANNFAAKRLGVWTDTFNARARIATVLGKFNPYEAKMWLNTNYSKNGFCYLVPFSSKEASLVQIINGITSYELDYYWKEFLFTEDINYYISYTADTEHDCGFVQPRQVENIMLTGNSAGFTDDFIGCGGLNAIESGMLAARSIVFGKDYNTLSMPIFKDIVRLHEFRKSMNTLDNRKLRYVVRAAGFPIVKQAIYNNPFFRLSHLSKTMRAYNLHISGRRNPVE